MVVLPVHEPLGAAAGINPTILTNMSGMLEVHHNNLFGLSVWNRKKKCGFENILDEAGSEDERWDKSEDKCLSQPRPLKESRPFARGKTAGIHRVSVLIQKIYGMLIFPPYNGRCPIQKCVGDKGPGFPIRHAKKIVI